jgi:aspartyl-tRNA(Asn)/glutamyl-tRNA(Gln) amidotransferase subunit A
MKHSKIKIVKVDIALTPDLICNPWLLIRLYEAWKIHSRIIDKYCKLYSIEVKKMLIEGKNIPLESYRHAINTVYKIKRYFSLILEKIDFLVTPTTIISAPKSITTKVKIENNVIKVRDALLRNTILFNSLGIPALTVPIGFNRSTKMPIGLQIVGKSHHDKEILDFGYYVEKEFKF